MQSKKVKRFNIESIDDPEVRGRLDQFRLFRGKYQVDYGQPRPFETGYFAVEMFEEHFFRLGRPVVSGQEDLSNVKARLFHYVEEQLQSYLSQSPTQLNLEIPFDKSVAEKLINIDPDRVNRGGMD